MNLAPNAARTSLVPTFWSKRTTYARPPEVDAVTHASDGERYQSGDDEYGGYNIGVFAFTDEIYVSVTEEVFGEFVRELDVPAVRYGSLDHQTGDEYRRKERGDDTYDKSGGEALHGTCTEYEEYYTGKHGGHVTVYDGRVCVLETVGYG